MNTPSLHLGDGEEDHRFLNTHPLHVGDDLPSPSADGGEAAVREPARVGDADPLPRLDHLPLHSPLYGPKTRAHNLNEPLNVLVKALGTLIFFRINIFLNELSLAGRWR